MILLAAGRKGFASVSVLHLCCGIQRSRVGCENVGDMSPGIYSGARVAAPSRPWPDAGESRLRFRVLLPATAPERCGWGRRLTARIGESVARQGARRNPLGQSREPAPQLMGSTQKRCCARGKNYYHVRATR